MSCLGPWLRLVGAKANPSRGKPSGVHIQAAPNGSTLQTVEEKLKKAGMVFNRTEPAKFRAVLSSAGYYKEWKATYGEKAWTLLERYGGSLG